MMFDSIEDYVGLGEVLAAIAIAWLYVKSRIPKQTIEQQALLITALEKRIKAMEDDNKEQLKHHIEAEKAIADLQGQIKVYKELPLQEISVSLKALSNLPKEFEDISKRSAESIITAVGNIQSQHVENQTVRTETVSNQTVTSK
jgi:hypothetical protein